MAQIGILDYGMGNLRSVYNALVYLDLQPAVIRSGEEVARFDRIILPGVGAYAMAIENLKAKGFFEAVLAHWRQGKPLLGICLGMQLLSSSGTEPEPTAGLGIIPGEVVHFEPSRECCVPHVGWNNVTSSRAHPIFKGIKPGVDFYFVHSYRFAPQQDADVLATTDYGGPFVSAVTRGSAIGFQFHPEKSQANGLKLLANFAAWDGTC